MKKIIFLIILFITQIQLSHAQSNMVLNPGFEEHDTCWPAQTGFGRGQVKYWSDPTFASSDYYLKYAFDTRGGSFTPCNYRNPNTPPRIDLGFEFPHQGECYGGMVINRDSIFREYVQASFRSRLDSNKRYAIECFVSMAEFEGCTCDFGFYFTDTMLERRTDGTRINGVAQFQNPVSNPINTKNGWQRITGSYLSDGNDSFVSIGDFTPQYLHTGATCRDGTYFPVESYLLIDDVAVYDTSLIDTVMLCINDSVVFNNQWYKQDGLYIDMIGGLPVKRLIKHRPFSASYTFIDVPFNVGDTVIIGFMAVCHADSFIHPYLTCDSSYNDSITGPTCVTDFYLWPIVNDTLIDQHFVNIYGCDSTVRYRVRTNDTLSNIGIAAIDKGMYALEIYPNPANDLINIKMRTNSVETMQYKVEVYDYVGRKIELPGQSSPTNAAKSQEVHFQLQIGDINDGMYFVRILDSHHKVVGSGKFVKE